MVMVCSAPRKLYALDDIALWLAGPHDLVERLRAELDVAVAALVAWGWRAIESVLFATTPTATDRGEQRRRRPSAANTPNDLPLVQRRDRVIGDEQPGRAEADDDAHVEHEHGGDDEQRRRRACSGS